MIKTCPWCNSKPKYKVYKWDCNYNHIDGIQEEMKFRETEIIECSNTNCKVRPKIIRVESGDAEEIWNYRPGCLGT